MNQPIFLYHYSTKKLNELYTLEKQWELGISKKPDNFSKFETDKYPYQKHISFFIDPIPLKLVRKEFTKNKTYQENDRLYEHRINIEVLKENLLWFELMESPIDTFMLNYFWDLFNLINKKEYYFKLGSLIKNLKDYQGNNYKDLLKVIDKFQGKTEEAYQRLIESDELNKNPELRGYYAPNVQHLFIYPKNGIILVEEIEVKSLL